MQNNNSLGTWKTENDTLIIFFDSIKNQHNKFKGEWKFVIKKNKLEYMPFPKSRYNEIVKFAEQTGKKIPSYRTVNKITNKGLKNFTGKTGKQYFKKIDTIDCK